MPRLPLAAALVLAVQTASAAPKPSTQAQTPARPWAVRATDTKWGSKADPYEGKASTGAGVAKLDGREKETTAPAGTKRFTLKVPGRDPLKFHEQVELERRVVVPPKGVASDHQSLVIDLLDRFVVDKANATESWTQDKSVVIAPLTSRYQHTHRTNLKGKGYLGPIALDKNLLRRYTRELQGNPIAIGAKGKEWATIQRNYIVELKHETGTYYDTPDQALRQRKIALRDKAWHPITEAGEVQAPTARGIFAKENVNPAEARALGLPADEFTARKEAHAQVEADIKPEELTRVMASLARRYGLSEAQARTVRPTVQVDTDRASVDIVVRGKKVGWAASGDQEPATKVGFMTIDVYRAKSLLPEDAGKPPSKAVTQFEFELLPEGRALYEKNPAEFQRLFREIEKAYGAKIDVNPKYVTGLKMTSDKGR